MSDTPMKGFTGRSTGLYEYIWEVEAISNNYSVQSPKALLYDVSADTIEDAQMVARMRLILWDCAVGFTVISIRRKA